MSDDDWGVEEDVAKKEVEQPADPPALTPPTEQKHLQPKQEENKQEEVANPDLDESESWIVDNLALQK